MKQKSLLCLGTGGCGCRLAQLYSQKFKTKSILFNTAETDVESEDVILLKDDKDNSSGSGRNPLFTLQTVAPKNKDLMVKKFDNVIKDVDRIITFSSSGGGTGLPLLSYIVDKILSKYNIPIYSIIILPFKSEGNPQCSNSVIMIKKFMEKCSKYVTPMLLRNDTIYVEGERTTFDLTNESVVDFTDRIFTYDKFNGQRKNNSISTLDEQEFNRILEPANGFLSVNVVRLEDFKDSPISENYNLNSAKKMLIMFQTNGIGGKLKYTIDKLHEMYPSPVKIVAESKGKNIVKVLSNGLELPKFYANDISDVLKNIKTHKKKVKDSKTKFKTATKKINDSLLKI